MKLAQKTALAYLRFRLAVTAWFSVQRAAADAFRLFCTPRTRNLNPLPAPFQRASPLSFVYEGGQVSGYQWNSSHRPTILIIHGFESSVVNFGGLVEELLRQTPSYQLLAFDAPAHGRSEGKTINVLQYRDFIKTLVQRYGPVDYFIAHSVGGLATGMALAELEPDPTRKVVLIAPLTQTSTAVDQFFHVLRLSQPVRLAFEKHIEQLSQHPVSWFSLTRVMQEIDSPVLWVHDETDLVTPIKDVFQVREENHPFIHFVFTNGLGHSKIYRDPTVIGRIIEFLNK